MPFSGYGTMSGYGNPRFATSGAGFLERDPWYWWTLDLGSICEIRVKGPKGAPMLR